MASDSESTMDTLLEVLGSLRRTARRTVGPPFPDHDLTGAQRELVRLLRRRPGLSVSEAAAALGVADNTVSTLVRQLVTAGIVVRDHSPHDRRVAHLDLSPDARRRVTTWRDQRIDGLAHALDTLTDADRRAIRVALPALSRLTAAVDGGTDADDPASHATEEVAS